MLDLAFTLVDGGGDYTDDLTLTLDMTQPGVNAAPSPVWFNVTNVTGADAAGPVGGDVYDPQFHDIIYVWDFDDAANATPTSALNMPEAWKDTNKAYGREAAHVFNDPRGYTVRCTAYEPATRRKGSKTISVMVDDPDMVFPTTKTIIFNPGGNADTSGYPGANVQATWAGVKSARDALGYGSDARILIAPGITLAGTQLAAFVDWSNIRIGPLDPTAAKPVIGPIGLDATTGGNGQYFVVDKRAGTSETMIYGLSFVGEWDSTSETGKLAAPFSVQKTDYVGIYGFTLHRCDFDGFTAVQGTGSLRNAGQAYFNVFSDCHITNWQNYGVFGSWDGIRTAFLGCSIAQHVDALSGGPKNNLYNNHGAIRDVGADSLVISACELFSRNGWSTGGTDANGYGVTADQACLRINTIGADNRFCNMDRLVMEGAMWIEEQDSTGIDVPGNHVFDKVLQVMGSRCLSEVVECRYGGATFRNYLGVKLDGPQAITTIPLRKWFLLENANGTAENGRSPIHLYNTTLIDLRTDADAKNVDMALFRQGSSAQFDMLAVENNIDYQPNRGAPVTGDAPIDITTAIAGFAPRHKGPRYNFQHETGSLNSTVADGASFVLAYAGVKSTQANIGGADDGAVTDQAYWSGLVESSHRMRIRDGGTTLYYADDGDFAVVFGAAEITITNNSGVTWNAGATFDLRLDRRSLIPAFDPALSSVGKLVPTGSPQAGSPAIDSGDAGLKAYDAFDGAERPATGNERGARLV